MDSSTSSKSPFQGSSVHPTTFRKGETATGPVLGPLPGCTPLGLSGILVLRKGRRLAFGASSPAREPTPMCGMACHRPLCTASASSVMATQRTMFPLATLRTLMNVFSIPRMACSRVQASMEGLHTCRIRDGHGCSAIRHRPRTTTCCRPTARYPIARTAGARRHWGKGR